jgi:energy-coupling factor transport system ATP-binding protein
MIEFVEFTYWYPNVAKPALESISLKIEDGETVLIIGPSGCGKSTLLLAVNAVVPQMTGGKVKGRVFVDGDDTRTTPVATLAATVGLILQDPESQLSNLYVFDEVAFGPENLVLPVQEIYERTNMALQKSGLSDLKDRSVFALSGGQKQRVAIAASLAMLPRTILLDNPTSNLDPLGAVETYRAIRELRQGNPEMTIILADHRPDHIIDIVDRIIVMDEGKIISDGSPRNVYSKNGRKINSELGIFLPQVVDLSLQLEEKGYPIDPIPLTLWEAEEQLSTLNLQVVDELGTGSLSSINRDYSKNDAQVLELEDVHFSYPNNVHAVNGVTLNVNAGEFLCLVGQNGSGKTTLAKLMVGLLRASSGNINFLGRKIGEIPLRDLVGRVGYVFQYPEHQFVTHNVYDEIAFSLRALKKTESEVEQRTKEMLEMFSLQDAVNTSPLMLSKGQKRRLSVATMLVTYPEVLILDEPMTGQDQKNIKNLLATLNQMRSRGTTIIDITHDMEHVASYGDRVVGMDQGKVIFDGSPVDLFLDQKVLEKLSLEAPPIVELGKILRKTGKPLPKNANTIPRLMEYIHAVEDIS